MILSLTLAYFAAAAALPAALRRWGQPAAWIGLAPSVAAAAYLITAAPGVIDGKPLRLAVDWAPSLGIGLDLSLDAVGLAMGLVVTVVGGAIFAYAIGYSGSPGRLVTRLNVFAGAMFGLVVSDNLFGLFVFWELTTVSSYSLIAYDDRSEEARRAGLHALLVTAGGGLVMLAGFVLLGIEGGTYLVSELAAAPPSGTTATIALGLVLAGIVTKSAQIPFHGWLPSAMAAPTPASAFLHAATMVKAGVFLAIRLHPVAAGDGLWESGLLGLGLATMAVGGWAALRETDLKRILAYGTVAQLGLLTALVGRSVSLTAGAAMLLAHAGFKAALFLVVGAIDKATGTRDIRVLTGLRRSHPALFWIAVAAGASMAGVPATLGFVAKEAALDLLLKSDPAVAWAIAVGSILTVAYTLRVLRVFTGASWGGAAHPVSLLMTIPAGLLAAAGILLGLLTAPVARLTESIAATTGAAVTALPAWPGLKPALALSLGTLALGWMLGRIAVPQRRGIGRADRGFDAAVAGLLAGARAVTATLQNGSLPVYLVIILATVVAVPGSALAAGLALPEGAVLAESGLQIALAVAAVVAAAALVVVGNRLGAVLLLGVVGYGMAGLFALQGAPDLALTQVLVETVTLVVFAIVLARLPERFTRSRRPAVGPALRAVVALAVGTFVAGAMFTAGAARTAAPVSEAYIERSLEEGYGRNVVNVILTDFRALDTFGEIAVVATAAIGVAGLALGLRRRETR